MTNGVSSARPAWERAAILIGIVAFALRPALPPWITSAIGLLLMLLAIRPADRIDVHQRAAGAIVGGLLIYAGALRPWYVWPAYFLVPIGLAWAGARFGGYGDGMRRAMSLGHFGTREGLAIGAIALVAALALVGWTLFFQPDLTHAASMLPDWPIAGLVLAALAFSILNAALEEFIWRGLLLRWFASMLSPALAIVAQAVSFGAAHYRGVPSGTAGAALATVYGLMLGWLAWRSRGLLAAFVAHIAADLVIVLIVGVYALA